MLENEAKLCVYAVSSLKLCFGGNSLLVSSETAPKLGAFDDLLFCEAQLFVAL